MAVLAGLLAEDHRFIDAAGGVVAGKQAVLDAWQGFFGLFPDYRNRPETYRLAAGEVAMAGRSQCSDPRLDGPALWRATTRGGRVRQWQVYSDTPENRRRLGLD